MWTTVLFILDQRREAGARYIRTLARAASPRRITCARVPLSREMTAKHVQRLNARRHGAVPDGSSGRSRPVAPERFNSGFLPIAAYAFLSDCRSPALVGSDGSIDWLCWPRFDSHALFSAVLDADRGGSFRLAPNEPYAVSRRYVKRPNVLQTNVLQTTFQTLGGTVRVDDWLTFGGSQAPCRVATCLRATVDLDALCDPRPDYGAAGPPTWAQSGGSLLADVGLPPARPW
jgi:hypothetical protein